MIKMKDIKNIFVVVLYLRKIKLLRGGGEIRS